MVQSGQARACPPRSLGTVAAFLILGLVVSGGLLLLATGRQGLSGRLSSAATALRTVSICPQQPLECPDCATLRAAANGTDLQRQNQTQQHEEEKEEEEEQQQQQQSSGQPPPPAGGHASVGGDVPLLCGGPGSVPSVQDALAYAWVRLEASLDAAFAPFAGGFTLEDLMATADALGVDGTHDTQVWVEIRNQTGVFPRRDKQECKWFCNEWIRPRIEGIERGMRDGWLRIPEGLPMLWNVYDYSVCKPGVCTAPLLSSIKWAEDADVLVPPFGPHYKPYWVPWEDKSDTAFFREQHVAHQRRAAERSTAPMHMPARHQLLRAAPAQRYRRQARRQLLARRAVRSVPPVARPAQLQPAGARRGARAARRVCQLQVPAGAGWLHRLEPPGQPAANQLRRAEAGVAVAGMVCCTCVCARPMHAAAPPPAGTAALPSKPHTERAAIILRRDSLLCPPCRYYAALQPCVHYLPFWRQSEDDVLGLLRTLHGAPANEALARSLAANSYTFAAAVLGDAGVYRFWQRVIDRYVQLYRGPANASAAKAAKAWAERVGRKASAHGAVVEAQCWRDGGQACWYVGRDAGRAIVQEEREKRDMAAAESAAADGGAGGASTSDKGRKRGKKGKNAAIAAEG